MAVPRSFEDGAKKNRSGQADLDRGLHAPKRAAAVDNPYSSRSDRNANFAKNNWRSGAKRKS